MHTLSNTSPEIQTMKTDLYDENGILLIAKGMPITKFTTIWLAPMYSQWQHSSPSRR